MDEPLANGKCTPGYCDGCNPVRGADPLDEDITGDLEDDVPNEE